MRKKRTKRHTPIFTLLAAYANGKKAVEEVLNTIKDLTIEDLHTKVENGPDKGKTVFWWLMYAASRGHKDALRSIWEKHKDSYTLSLDDFRTKPDIGQQKGMSVLWLLADLTFSDPKLFLEVWEKHQNSNLLDDLIKTQKGFKGESALMRLATAAAFEPTPFLAVWVKYKNIIPFHDILTKVKKGPEKGKSVLWKLAMAATAHPEVFIAVWEKHQNAIPVEDLILLPEKNELDKGMLLSVFWLLAEAALDKRILCIQEIVKKLLKQQPLILGESELKNEFNLDSPLKKKLLECEDKRYAKYIQKLFRARHALHKAIVEVQKKKKLPSEEISTLSELAKKAKKAGYRNAFYDIGALFLEKGKPHAACLAFQKVSAKGKQFTAANVETANTLLAEVLREEDKKERHQRLTEALWFALRVQDENERVTLLQKMAYIHVKEKGLDFEMRYFIDPAILRTLTIDSPLEDCLRLFEQEYERIKLLAKEKSTSIKEIITNQAFCAPLLFSEVLVKKTSQALPVKELSLENKLKVVR